MINYDLGDGPGPDLYPRLSCQARTGRSRGEYESDRAGAFQAHARRTWIGAEPIGVGAGQDVSESAGAGARSFGGGGHAGPETELASQTWPDSELESDRDVASTSRTEQEPSRPMPDGPGLEPSPSGLAPNRTSPSRTEREPYTLQTRSEPAPSTRDRAVKLSSA